MLNYQRVDKHPWAGKSPAVAIQVAEKKRAPKGSGLQAVCKKYGLEEGPQDARDSKFV